MEFKKILLITSAYTLFFYLIGAGIIYHFCNGFSDTFDGLLAIWKVSCLLFWMIFGGELIFKK